MRRVPPLNLSAKLGLFVFAISVCPLLVVGLLSYNVAQQVSEGQATQYNQALLEQQTDYVDLILRQIESLIGSVSGVDTIKSALDESSAKYETAAWIETLAARPLLFKSARGPERAAHKADELMHRYLEARRRHFRRLFAQTVGGMAIQVVASTALLGLGGALVLDGQLTLGQLVAAELVVSGLGYAFGRIGKYLEQVYDLVASVNKLAVLVDLPTERTDGEPLRSLDYFAMVDAMSRLERALMPHLEALDL